MCRRRPLCPGCVVVWSLRGLCAARSAPCFAVPCRRGLLNHLSFAHCAVFLLRACVAFLIELTELAEPVEMPRLCCSQRSGVLM